MIRDDLQRISALFFTSRVRTKIMTLFFLNPRERLHMRKISRLVNEQINAVRRELMSMEKTEFLLTQKDGIKKFYMLNPDFPYYNELRSMFVKSMGLGQILYQNRKELGEIKFAVLTHTYLNREQSAQNNPDMLIIGNPDLDKLEEFVKQAELLESRQIFYAVMTEKDLDVAKRRKDTLIYSLSVLPRSVLIGTEEQFVEAIV